jgi:hypothetical protein
MYEILYRFPGVTNSLQVTAVVIYRLKFHPLAKYPGPLLGRITDWYSVIRSLRGDRHVEFLHLHEKYGM